MYEWDEAKRQANLRKHGVDFAMVEPYGEQRMTTIGPIGLRLHVLVWTPRGDSVRVISLRLADKREIKWHEKEF